MTDDIDFEVQEFLTFNANVTLTFTLDPAIDLYLHTKFHSNRRNFLWTDGRTYVRRDVRTELRTDGQTSRPALFGRLPGVDLKTDTETVRQTCRQIRNSDTVAPRV